MKNLKRWFSKRVIEPSTMAALGVLLAVFYPGEGAEIQEHLTTIFTTAPSLLMAVLGLAGILLPEGTRKDE